MIRFAIAPNSFRNSLTVFEAVSAIRLGLERALPAIQCVELPVADGGDFTAQVLHHYLGGEFHTEQATDPLGRPISPSWLLLGDVQTALVEVAAASGNALLRRDELDPLRATSYGTGEVILAALQHGCRQVIITLGGSATVDGGAGILQALGVRLLDVAGNPIMQGGASLADLDRIDLSQLDPVVSQAQFEMLCDVDNPLVGEHGAAMVFGPQKGATPEMSRQLDANLAQFAAVIQRDCDRAVADVRHGGAAGGISAGLHGVLGAKLRQGTEVILERIGFAERLHGCDLVITAEGKLDSQTLRGKAPYGVARAAQSMGIPVIALAGQIEDSDELMASGMFDAIMPIVDRPLLLEDAIANTPRLLADAAERVVRLITVGGALRSHHI